MTNDDRKRLQTRALMDQTETHLRPLLGKLVPMARLMLDQSIRKRPATLGITVRSDDMCNLLELAIYGASVMVLDDHE